MVLEMLILLVFLLINLTILSVKMSGIFVFMFITLSVAEARVGISLLTMLVRRNGNDFIGVSIF
jgi:NADH:ubiquinone oxidoreductase subunit K